VSLKHSLDPYQISFWIVAIHIYLVILKKWKRLTCVPQVMIAFVPY